MPPDLEKIVVRRRGGWCLELTGLFSWALAEIGFRVDVLGGKVMFPDGALPAPNSHMVALVHLNEYWIMDVGFGGRSIEPLRLDERQPQAFERRSFVVANDAENYFVTGHDPWVSSQASRTYFFTLQPREQHEFLAGCEWSQTSRESPFTRGDIATLPLPQGRVTYAAGRLQISAGDDQSSFELSVDERSRVLAERFGIEL